MRRLVALVAAWGFVLAGPAIVGPATPVVLGHSRLVTSAPAAGEVVDASPTEIRLVFSEPTEPPRDRPRRRARRRSPAACRPDGQPTQLIPPSLTAHLSQHTDGDFFNWISNGPPGGMPAWESQFNDTDRWILVNFLRSINGQGPTARPFAAATAADRLALLFPVGFATAFGGWLTAGLWRSPAEARVRRQKNPRGRP